MSPKMLQGKVITAPYPYAVDTLPSKSRAGRYEANLHPPIGRSSGRRGIGCPRNRRAISPGYDLLIGDTLENEIITNRVGL
jgi:hypothetical protein